MDTKKDITNILGIKPEVKEERYCNGNSENHMEYQISSNTIKTDRAESSVMWKIEPGTDQSAIMQHTASQQYTDVEQKSKHETIQSTDSQEGLVHHREKPHKRDEKKKKYICLWDGFNERW